MEEAGLHFIAHGRARDIADVDDQSGGAGAQIGGRPGGKSVGAVLFGDALPILGGLLALLVGFLFDDLADLFGHGEFAQSLALANAVEEAVKDADAVLVDNTAMDVEETARLVVMLAREREMEVSKTAGSEM